MTMTIEQLQSSLIAAGCGKEQELRQHTAKSHGHQGDVYCHPIGKRPACWDIETTDQSRQVAVGQGEGSNHRASGKIRIFWPKSSDQAADNCPISLFPDEVEAHKVCIGPIIEADGPWSLTHPKHAHHEFPAGVYFISYQLDRSTMKRVQD